MLSILIIEDEPAFVDALEVALEREGLEVSSAADGRQGLAEFRTIDPDVVLLDLMLPELSGLDVLRGIRAKSSTPVIVVSAKNDESDVVSALELGADDYLTKPYSIRELLARIRAVVRRGSAIAQDDELLEVGTAVLDGGRYELRLGNEVFDLPRKEFEVIHKLMERPGKVVPRETLLDEVWGHSWGDSKTLDQHIRRLRRKLESVEGAPVITTVRGVGYRLEP